ncbi:C40 family peptidase, partial [Nocardia sp. CDC160]|uniref:C40 family peptidase n=1 Tax=Nocardia sp. CDC160 TaxID=3112166 RepID=UPI002DB9FD66
GNTHTTNHALAQAINNLTLQYLYTLAGKPNPASRSASPAVQEAISTALLQVGKPYVYGGAGPDNFDCSGLVQYALAAAGVKVPHGATDQYNMFPKVASADIRPGDLIFPTDEINFSTGYVGHVMIYLGNGECIAASNPSVPVGRVPLPPSYEAARWS